jgi:prepilin-type processing-associated H-X9-DG protein
MDLIYPYVKSRGVYTCPSAVKPNVSSAGDEVTSGGLPAPSYAYNSGFYGVNTVYSGSPGWLQPVKISIVPRSSEVFLLLGHNRYYGNANPSSTNSILASPQGSEFRYVFNHMDGTNVLYADGHSKWQSAETIRSNIPTTCIGNTFYDGYPGYCRNATQWNPFRN